MKKQTAEHGRRAFLKSSLAFGAVSMVAPVTSVAAVSEIEDEFKVIAGPCLQTSFNNAISVLWVTNKNAASWAIGLAFAACVCADDTTHKRQCPEWRE